MIERDSRLVSWPISLGRTDRAFESSTRSSRLTSSANFWTQFEKLISGEIEVAQLGKASNAARYHGKLVFRQIQALEILQSPDFIGNLSQLIIFDVDIAKRY